MRLLIAACFTLALTSVQAQIPPPATWNTTNAHEGYVAQGQGDPWSEAGATISISSKRDAAGKHGGAISASDAAPLRGRRVVLSASLSADTGTEGTAIWLRVEGPKGKLAFTTSGYVPIAGGADPAVREVALLVPPQATQLIYGLVFNGNGAARAEAFKLRVEDVAPAAAAETGAARAGAGQSGTSAANPAQSASSNATAAQVLEAALRLVREHALKADAVDWKSTPPRLRAGVDPNGPAQDAHAAVRLLLQELGDGHSQLLDANLAEQHQRSGNASEKAVVEIRAGNLGYVRMPGFSGRGKDASRQFAATISGDIARLAPQASQGWIVDLRHNSGGNMWPMLAALRPLLGAEKLGSSRQRDGQEQPWQLNADPAAAPLPDLRNARVAVLIGAKTSSSGEAVATAFRGRPGTRSFGQTSDGRATMNNGFALPDGSLLQLTTAWMVDRKGDIVAGRLAPDEPIALAAKDRDDTLQAASTWLLHKP